MRRTPLVLGLLAVLTCNPSAWRSGNSTGSTLQTIVETCTSGDAAGFPIAPLLFNADEVHAAMQTSGDLGHAIRFILPNARMASTLINGPRLPVYVRPTGQPCRWAVRTRSSVPYGSRLRLRADFPVASYSPAAQVILRTLQRYGMVLADEGTSP